MSGFECPILSAFHAVMLSKCYKGCTIVYKLSSGELFVGPKLKPLQSQEQDYVAGLALFHLSRCQAQSSWFCTLMELTEGIGLIVWASVREDVLC
ncbi:hypothetical protein ACET3Z_002967 [Daucus carota]